MLLTLDVDQALRAGVLGAAERRDWSVRVSFDVCMQMLSEI
jgi:hypothetical protein